MISRAQSGWGPQQHTTRTNKAYLGWARPLKPPKASPLFAAPNPEPSSPETVAMQQLSTQH